MSQPVLVDSDCPELNKRRAVGDVRKHNPQRQPQRGRVACHLRRGHDCPQHLKGDVDVLGFVAAWHGCDAERKGNAAQAIRCEPGGVLTNRPALTTRRRRGGCRTLSCSVRGCFNLWCPDGAYLRPDAKKSARAETERPVWGESNARSVHRENCARLSIYYKHPST